MPIPERLRGEPAFYPDVTHAELLAVFVAIHEGELADEERAAAIELLERNLPNAAIADLIDWPGKWFNNRWMEEAVFTPDELLEHALDRCERELG